jgi:hypothetical protein
MTSVEYKDSTKEPKRSPINAQATVTVVWIQMYYGLWTRKTLLYHVVDCNRSFYLLLCYKYRRRGTGYDTIPTRGANLGTVRFLTGFVGT